MSTHRLVAVGRLLVAVLSLAGIVAIVLHVLQRGPLNPFNLFGYFTVQSNLLFGAVLPLAAATAFRGTTPPPWLDLLRGFVTVYIVIVGLVYAVLLAPLGAEGGVPVPWANVVHHMIAPAWAALDWWLVGDRAPLPWSRLGWVLLYPALWLTVVLIRGATDGWVPYPFLDPANGYGAVAVVCVGICLAFLAVAALVFWLSRHRPLRLPATAR